MAFSGLKYLHYDLSPAIIHRDLKSENILLNDTLQAKIADFGLRKTMSDESHVSTVPKGTVGFADFE